MTFSKHGEKRLKKRCKYNNKNIEHFTMLALKNGLSHNQVSGQLKKYCDKLFLSHRNGNNIKIYNSNVYVFHNEKLITVFPLLHNLVKAELKLKEKLYNT